MGAVVPLQHPDAAGVAVASGASSAALVVCDREGHIQRSNAAWSQLFGRSDGRALSLFDAALHAEGEQGVQGLLQALQDAGGVVDALALRLLRQDGAAFAARMRCSTMEVDGHTWYSAWITDEGPLVAVPHRQPLSEAPDLLLDNLLAGAFAMADGKVVRANATFARMFGFADADSLLGLEIPCLFEDDAEFQRFDAESRRSFAQDGTCSSSWRARRQDGSIFQTQARGRSVEMAGVRDAVVWMVQDEAEVRGAEEIRKENESYSRMFQQSHIAISIYDPATDCYVDCNEAARKLYGFERAEDVVGRTVLSISAPMQALGPTEKILAAGRRNLNTVGQESPSFEWRHRRPDGTDWLAECRGTTFRYRGRTLIQFTLIDITAAKEVQRQVKEMAVFLQTMIDRMPNAVCYRGPDTRFLGCNEAFEQAFGVQREDLLGKRVDEMEHLTEPLARAKDQVSAAFAVGRCAKERDRPLVQIVVEPVPRVEVAVRRLHLYLHRARVAAYVFGNVEEIGRRQVDGNFLRGKTVAAVFNCGTHPLAGLLHGLIRKPYHHKLGQAVCDVDFHFDGIGFYA